ncbi:Ulp1 protease family, C-terminal catalytic domain [Phytophthora cactorum]|nr:Ulp1 protease family, C-terminal catalytic domain [Phytophthora cactorum]
MPLDINVNHWTCIVVDKVKHKIYCYDSMDKRANRNLLEDWRTSLSRKICPIPKPRMISRRWDILRAVIDFGDATKSEEENVDQATSAKHCYYMFCYLSSPCFLNFPCFPRFPVFSHVCYIFWYTRVFEMGSDELRHSNKPVSPAPANMYCPDINMSTKWAQ